MGGASVFNQGGQGFVNQQQQQPQQQNAGFGAPAGGTLNPAFNNNNAFGMAQPPNQGGFNNGNAKFGGVGFNANPGFSTGGGHGFPSNVNGNTAMFAAGTQANATLIRTNVTGSGQDGSGAVGKVDPSKTVVANDPEDDKLWNEILQGKPMMPGKVPTQLPHAMRSAGVFW